MTLAAFEVLATAAISSPMGNSPAMETATESTSPAGLFGAGAPRRDAGDDEDERPPATATASWMTPCAASSQDGGTGVVDRRRRMPSSR